MTIGGLSFDALHLLGLAVCVALAGCIVIQRNGRKREQHTFERERIVAERDGVRASGHIAQLQEENKTLRAMAEAARIELAKLEGRRDEEAAKFTELAHTVLERANAHFLQLANETFEKHKTTAKGDLEKLMQPIGESFDAFKSRVDALERVRTQDRSAMTEQIRHITSDLQQNRLETSKLVAALSAPKGGGRWGETTLRNVMEHAGLSKYCDFSEQVHDQIDGQSLRPDVVIRLPGGREIVVDAKVSLDDYLKATRETDTPARSIFLKAHARNVRQQIKALGSKAYQDAFSNRVDFIVMFIPGENFYMAALEQDPDLFDFAADRKVIVTTPSTLLALARAVAYGWRQDVASQKAREAAELGRELYGRLLTLGGHLDKLGKTLNGAVESYNKLGRSLETRVLPKARKFQSLNIVDDGAPLQAPSLIENRAQRPDPAGELELNEENA